MAVVDIIADIYSQEPQLIHLVQLLVFFASLHSFWFMSEHIPGLKNEFADALSRNNASLFLSQVPQASQSLSSILPPLVTLITQSRPWTSTAWMTQFDDILRLL